MSQNPNTLYSDQAFTVTREGEAVYVKVNTVPPQTDCYHILHMFLGEHAILLFSGITADQQCEYVVVSEYDYSTFTTPAQITVFNADRLTIWAMDTLNNVYLFGVVRDGHNVVVLKNMSKTVQSGEDPYQHYSKKVARKPRGKVWYLPMTVHYTHDSVLSDLMKNRKPTMTNSMVKDSINRIKLLKTTKNKK